MARKKCTECPRHYIGHGYYCWSGNKSLGYCDPYGARASRLIIYKANEARTKTYEDYVKEFGDVNQHDN